MPALTCFSNGILVTGSEGFLGSNLCRLLGGVDNSETVHASVNERHELALLSRRWNVDTVVHLASNGTVVGPRQGIPAMLDVTVDGTLNLIESFQPARFLLASSCAIYGETNGVPAMPRSDNVHPVSVYGLSKAIAELILLERSRREGQHATVLRFGNLIGAGAKGLIRYLVKHAISYPGAERPAMMRGGGKLLRDYVPVDYAIRIIKAALDSSWPDPFSIFNVGTGTPRTNRRIAEMVQGSLSELGLDLEILFSDAAEFGEAQSAVLDCTVTTEYFGIAPPDEAGIALAVRETVLSAVGASLPVLTRVGAL